jgi:hypothetical protein
MMSDDMPSAQAEDSELFGRFLPGEGDFILEKTPFDGRNHRVLVHL